jgi:hypothetical protein
MRYSCAAHRNQVFVANRERLTLTVLRSGPGRKIVPITPSIFGIRQSAARPLHYRLALPHNRVQGAIGWTSPFTIFDEIVDRAVDGRDDLGVPRIDFG